MSDGRWAITKSSDIIYLARYIKKAFAWYDGANYPNVRESVIVSAIVQALAN